MEEIPVLERFSFSNLKFKMLNFTTQNIINHCRLINQTSFAGFSVSVFPIPCFSVFPGMHRSHKVHVWKCRQTTSRWFHSPLSNSYGECCCTKCQGVSGQSQSYFPLAFSPGSQHSFFQLAGTGRLCIVHGSQVVSKLIQRKIPQRKFRNFSSLLTHTYNECVCIIPWKFIPWKSTKTNIKGILPGQMCYQKQLILINWLITGKV